MNTKPTKRLALALPFAVILAGGPDGSSFAGCKAKNIGDAEVKKDVAWLAEQSSPEAIAALGRLADSEPKALAALEGRAPSDVNTYIAAWGAVTRNATWGTSFLRTSLGDPTRAELAASAMPRRDPLLAPFTADLEGAIVRLAAGRSGSNVASLLASVGPRAHVNVERRLVDPKTRGAMCDGISSPERSADAKSLVLSAPPEVRDHPSCVALVLEMAKSDDAVIHWLASSAEPGMLNAAAKSSLACPRLATVWKSALTERSDGFAALAVPLQRSVNRCAPAIDAVLAESLTKAPRARTAIVQAIDPFGGDLASMPQTCGALRAGHANNETARVRERARDALANGCAFAR